MARSDYLALLALAVGISAASAQPASHVQSNAVTVGAPGRWDYLTFDRPGNRLYLAHGRPGRPKLLPGSLKVLFLDPKWALNQ